MIHFSQYLRTLFLTAFLLFLLSVHAVSAAEFAYIYGLKYLNTKNHDNGKSVSVHYGGFGLVGGVELKSIDDETFPALYGGFSTGQINLEAGINNKSPTVRAAIGIELFKDSDWLNDHRLYLKLGYEKYFDDDSYSGAYLGLDLLVFD